METIEVTYIWDNIYHTEIVMKICAVIVCMLLVQAYFWAVGEMWNSKEALQTS